VQILQNLKVPYLKQIIIQKIHIAYKELLETKYWINLLLATNDIIIEEADVIFNEIEELAKILYTIIRNIKAKKRN
jgi:four helix bundle protein